MHLPNFIVNNPLISRRRNLEDLLPKRFKETAPYKFPFTDGQDALPG